MTTKCPKQNSDRQEEKGVPVGSREVDADVQVIWCTEAKSNEIDLNEIDLNYGSESEQYDWVGSFCVVGKSF